MPARFAEIDAPVPPLEPPDVAGGGEGAGDVQRGAGGLERRELRRQVDRELVHARLGEDDGPVSAQALHHRGVGRRLVGVPASAARRGRHVRRVVVVLQRDRHAEQHARHAAFGARGVSGGSGGERRLLPDGDDRVERAAARGRIDLHAVVRGDAVDVLLRDLDGCRHARVHRRLHVDDARLHDLEGTVVVDHPPRQLGEILHVDRAVGVEVEVCDVRPVRSGRRGAEVLLEHCEIGLRDLLVTGQVELRVVGREERGRGGRAGVLLRPALVPVLVGLRRRVPLARKALQSNRRLGAFDSSTVSEVELTSVADGTAMLALPPSITVNENAPSSASPARPGEVPSRVSVRMTVPSPPDSTEKPPSGPVDEFASNFRSFGSYVNTSE